MNIKRIMATLIAITLTLGLMPDTVFASTTDDVIYSYWDDGAEIWRSDGNAIGATLLEDDAAGLSLDSGWYYADITDDVDITAGLTITGDVHIILESGSTLNVTGAAGSAGITIMSGSLSIYTQSGTPEGVFNITGGSADGAGVVIHSGAEFIIYGGTVTVGGDNSGAGIDASAGGTVTIYGGGVAVTGGTSSGKDIDGGTVNIIGGHLSVTGVDGTPDYKDAVDASIAAPVFFPITAEDEYGNPMAGIGISVSSGSYPYVFRTDALGRATLLMSKDLHEVEFYTEHTVQAFNYDTQTPVNNTLEHTVKLRTGSLIDFVVPEGTGVSIYTNTLSVKFMDKIDTSSGEIRLLPDPYHSPEPLLTNGQWSEDYTKITYTLTGLKANTKYTVSIAGFGVDGGKIYMLPDDTHWFITGDAPNIDNGPSSSPPTSSPPTTSAPTPAPAPAPPPAPDPNPTVTLTADDLDKMLQESPDGVMVLTIGGDLDSLEINVPLSWFMENLGATLLVYNEGLGFMAITSENMIEFAAQVYDGEDGGITIIINGKEMTFLPETIISYLVEKGSIILTVTAEGNSMKWYIYDSPLILGIPESELLGIDENLLVAYTSVEGIGRKIMPRSLVRNGFVYLLVNNEGRFNIMYNPVGFDDINGGWMDEAVSFVAAREIMNGVGDGLFNPSGALTRAQFVTMLMRMLDYEMSGYDPMPFIDIEAGSWYYESVCKAAELGIVDGVGDGRFAPDAYVTRQDIFTMTYRTLVKFHIIIPELNESTTGDPLSAFSDTDNISEYALKATAELARNGIVRGSNGMLYPHKTISRAEAAQLMMNIIEFIVPDFTDNILE